MTAEANEAMDELTGRLRRFVRARGSTREDAEDFKRRMIPADLRHYTVDRA